MSCQVGYMCIRTNSPCDERGHGGVVRVHAAHQLLGVVTEQLQDGKHGQTAVVELLVDALGLLLLGLGGLAQRSSTERVRLGGEGDGGAVGGESEIDRADQEDHLEPAQSGDGLDGGKAVGDGLERHTGGDLTREAVHLGHDVTQDGQLAHTAVLQLGESVFGELLLVNVLRKP